MADTVYNEEVVALYDGTEVLLRPLPIAPLRRFMDAWKGLDELKEDEDATVVFINCCGIALGPNFKDKFENLYATEVQKKKGEWLSAEYKEYLEETLDMDTIYKILDVAAGIKIDPKAQEAAARVIAERAAEAGTN